MNLSVSHIRLTDNIRNYLLTIRSLDKDFCKFKDYNFDDLYGCLSTTEYIEDILSREIIHLNALCEYYGLETNIQFVGSLDPETEEKTSESE